MFSRLKEHRFLIYQVAVSVLYASLLPYFNRDFRRVIVEQEAVLYIGVWGILAFVADFWGSMQKSKYIYDRGMIEIPTLISIPFSFLFWARLVIPIAGLFLTLTALTGTFGFDVLGDFKVPCLIAVVFLTLYNMFVCIKRIDEQAESNNRVEGLADIALFISSNFYFTAAWSVALLDLSTDWSAMTTEGLMDYVLGGVLFYLVLYIPTHMFFIWDRMLSFEERKEVITYVLGLVIIGFIVIVSSLLG